MLKFAPNVYMAVVGTKAVVLDLVRDRYLGLNERATEAAIALVGSDPSASASDYRIEEKKLVSRGILVDGGHPEIRRHEVKAISPIQAIWPTGRRNMHNSGSDRLFSTVSVMLALCDVWMTLKFLPFSKLVTRVAAEPVQKRTRGPLKSEQELVNEYSWSRPWFPIKPVCRLDGAALCLFMRRNGHPAKLVFGVTLSKFSAHCWVQCADHVLLESCELAMGYSQILVV